MQLLKENIKSHLKLATSLEWDDANLYKMVLIKMEQKSFFFLTDTQNLYEHRTRTLAH